MEQSTNNELDLTTIYRKVKAEWRNLLLAGYRWVLFLIKFWWVAAIVILAGVGVGYLMEQNQVLTRETKAVVQINFDAVDYVYNATEQLKTKIKEEDRRALAEMEGKFDDLFKVKGLEIEPIVDVRDLAKDVEPFNRNTEVFLEESKYEEDLLMSDMFISQYKLHRLIVTTTRDAGTPTVNAVIDYLNNNPAFATVKEIAIKNAKMEIEETKQSIALIDSIMGAYGTVTRDDGKNENVYVNTSSNVNMHLLVQEKTNLLKMVKQTETELLRYEDGILSLISKPMLYKTGRFLDKKMIIMPVLFFFFFLFTVMLYNLFQKLKVENETRQQA